MPEISEHSLGCPYCGETITVLVDDSVPDQNYIEDCQVCCRPMVLHTGVDADGELFVDARAENE